MKKKDNQLESKEFYSLSWGVEKRLEFIEFRLYWEDRINRADLIKVFNISVPQATADFNKYQELAPGNMLYNNRGKYYYAGPGFMPKFMIPSAEQYLLRFLAVEMGIYKPENSYIGELAPICTMPTPWRRVYPTDLKKILIAIKNNYSIEIDYQSLSRPERLKRWVTPHALGYDGFRWHCRAYCHLTDIFKDFNLGRIYSIEGKRESDVDPKNDIEWETIITVRIGPNPKLTKSQQEVIKHEYGMENGESSIIVKQAMTLYLLNRLGLSIEDDEPTTYQKKQHIILLNIDEVKKAMGKD
jgi:hypothetical protein